MKTTQPISYPALQDAQSVHASLFGRKGLLSVLVISFLLFTLVGLYGLLVVCSTEPSVRMHFDIKTAEDKRALQSDTQNRAIRMAAPFIKRYKGHETNTD